MTPKPPLDICNRKIRNIILLHCYLIAADIEDMASNFIPTLPQKIDQDRVRKHAELLYDDFLIQPET